MLENIHIQNFRCFEDFKAEGFERINLIGGKNNSGKTCLLEGILCLRKDDKLDNHLSDLALLRNEKIEDLLFQDLRNGSEIEGKIKVIGISDYGTFKDEFESTIRNSSPSSTLESALNIFYISQSACLPNIDFNSAFYKIENEEKTDKFIEILSKIDSSITKIRTIGRDGDTPKIKQVHNKTYLKLSSFGDAVKSIIRYFTPIIEREIFEKNKANAYILLIDEIENGLHYTAHYEFWKKIFSASKKLNIQIFATTHSKEMIEQFNIVSKEFEVINNEKTGAYFEMIRNVRTNKIVAHKYEAQELEYSLDNEKTFRGE
jgi:AAA15 family ATPase/GTPase